MKIIIFAGGTGKRFWPASRKNSPKQFLPTINNKPLVKIKYDYLRKGFKKEDIYLSTGVQYKKEVKKILKDLPKDNFIFEPEMRDTGPAVGLAVAYVNNIYPNEIICTQWSDHIIKDVNLFIETIKTAESVVKETNKSVIVGVPARYPTPYRGYIKFGDNIKYYNKKKNLGLFKFEKFVEKPSLEVSKRYLKTGKYSWNPGYFVTNPEDILDKYQRYAPNTHRVITNLVEDMKNKVYIKEFSKLERIAFDYIYPENLNSNDALVLNSSMGWSDVGEWMSIKEALELSNESNVTMGKIFDMDSKDCLIYNYDNKKLVSTVDLEGLIIVNTKDTVAIFRKDVGNKLKKYLDKLSKSKYKNRL